MLVSRFQKRDCMPSSTHQEVHTEVVNFFSKILNISVPSPPPDLFKTGILDSQNFNELLLHLERKYDAVVRLDDVDIEDFRCIGKIVNLLCENINHPKHAGN